jgi:hypothetical protein
MAIFGWFQVRTRNAQLAQTFLLYVTLVTVMHLLFVMNTRLRMPFIDPLLVVLAGIGALTLVSIVAARTGMISPSSAAQQRIAAS